MKKWHSVGWAFIRTQRRTLDIVLIFCQRSTCFYTLCILCNFATDYLCNRVCPCGSCALPLWKGRSCDSLAATADLPIGSQPPSPHQGCHWRDRSTWESPRGRERSWNLELRIFAVTRTCGQVLSSLSSLYKSWASSVTCIRKPCHGPAGPSKLRQPSLEEYRGEPF